MNQPELNADIHDVIWRLRNNWAGSDDLDVARTRLSRGGRVADRLRAEGWSGEGRPDDVVVGRALEALLGEPTATERAVFSSVPAPAKLKTLRERRLGLHVMMTTQPPKIDMVLRGLPLGAVGVILGSGGVGKSMKVLHVAYAVATGHDDLGCLLGDGDHGVGRVVYLAGEDSGEILHHRLHAFANNVDAGRREEVVAIMEERVDIVPLVGCAPSLLGSDGRLNEDAIGQIREAAKGARLLIIDPFRQFHSGDENDNGQMTEVLKALAQIAHEERCAIIIVHHVSKAGAKDDDDDAAMSRGASAITDNARWVMALSKMTESVHQRLGLDGEHWQYLRSRAVKANYAALGGVTVLVRREGGVLGPLPQTPDAIDVVEMIAGEGGSPPQNTEPMYDDGEMLDPATGEAFPPKPRGYEDRDLFGAA